MKVEILNDFKHEGADFLTGETRVVNDVDGEYFCRAGWVKDLDGVVKTESPSLNDTVLKVNNTSRTNKVGET